MKEIQREIELDTGINPHIYVNRNYPSYKYKSHSQSKNHLIKSYMNNYEKLLLVKNYVGEWYLFVK